MVYAECCPTALLRQPLIVLGWQQNMYGIGKKKNFEKWSDQSFPIAGISML